MTRQNRHLKRSGKNSLFSSSEGFTLIEVLVAMVLLAVGLTTLIELFSGSLSLAHSSRVYTIATFLANQKMGETLISEEDQTQSGNFEYPYENFNYDIEVNMQEESKWNLQIIDDMLAIIGEQEQIPPSPSLRKIRVKISWKENHRERNLTIETLQAMVINNEIEE
jgi:general secretion pathway protein I